MRRILIVVALLVLPPQAFAAGGTEHIRPAGHDPSNVKSLQRGARNYVNYCAGCHSAEYVRYSRIAEDLEIPETVLRENLMFGTGKVGSTMVSAMPEEHALAWFNAVPPDLSLTARSRGADWIFSYLTSFYLDDKAIFGVNNLVLKGASMPHVLAELQGTRKAVYEMEADHEGGEPHEVFQGFEQVEAGSLSDEEYESFVRDLTNFMAYMAEPMRLERESLGIKVLAFLTVMFILTYALKKEFWKDVH